MHERLCKPLSHAPQATTLNSQDSKRLRALAAKTASGGLRIYTGADVGTDRAAARMNTGASGRKYDRVHRGAVLGQTSQASWTPKVKPTFLMGMQPAEAMRRAPVNQARANSLAVGRATKSQVKSRM